MELGHGLAWLFGVLAVFKHCFFLLESSCSSELGIQGKYFVFNYRIKGDSKTCISKYRLTPIRTVGSVKLMKILRLP